MNLHEYQAKMLFAEYGVPVPRGMVAHSIDEALRHARALKGDGWVVKAQVHAGGRGKAGGVRLADDLGTLESIVHQMLGKRLVTVQSAPDGQPVNCVLIQEKMDLAREIYLGMLVDRASHRIVVVASSEGGIDIEEVAASHPERIFSVSVDPVLGLQHQQCRRIAFKLGLDTPQRKALVELLQSLYRAFIERDLSLIEVNPLVVTGDGQLLALDAKVTVDDNALYRQTALEEWRDPTQDDPKESIAKLHDLSYVALEGDIGCMVNGAGLAMATMDIIKLEGGRPANFLDVGGGATKERVTEAFKLICSDPNVKAILVNIFGGIVRCDLIAEGLIQAVREIDIHLPVVVRLEGTNVEQGQVLLAQSGLELVAAKDLADAARKVVTMVGGSG